MPAALEVGQRLGPYRIEARLGQGGMGIVFRALHDGDGRTVALKVLRDELGADDTFRRRLAHEARAVSGSALMAMSTTFRPLLKSVAY